MCICVCHILPNILMCSVLGRRAAGSRRRGTNYVNYVSYKEFTRLARD